MDTQTANLQIHENSFGELANYKLDSWKLCTSWEMISMTLGYAPLAATFNSFSVLFYIVRFSRAFDSWRPSDAYVRL